MTIHARTEARCLYKLLHTLAFSQCIAAFNLEKLLLSQLPTSISTSLKTPTWHHHDHHYHLRAPDQLTNIPINPSTWPILEVSQLSASFIWNQVTKLTDWSAYQAKKNWIPVTKTLNKDNMFSFWDPMKRQTEVPIAFSNWITLVLLRTSS